MSKNRSTKVKRNTPSVPPPPSSTSQAVVAKRKGIKYFLKSITKRGKKSSVNDKNKWIDFKVAECPTCRQTHTFTLFVEELEKSQNSQEQPETTDVILTCPTTGKHIVLTVPSSYRLKRMSMAQAHPL